MRVIWKFKIEGAQAEFDGPAGARAIKALVQPDGQPVVYLLCDREAPKAKLQIKLFPTAGNIPPEAGDYVDTLTIPGPSGPFVAHIFFKQLSVQLI